MSLNRYQRIAATDVLLQKLKEALPSLNELLSKVTEEWIYEDYVYRYYHQSFKVYGLQGVTTSIVEALTNIRPVEAELLNKRFLEIIQDGTGKTFQREHNEQWAEVTRPIVEAYMHAKFFLKMACKYGSELETAPNMLPSGWAALLYLYNIR